MHKPLVAVIVGPTASGKTALSIEIAKRLDGEIISADSMQIYKKMNIATAKPDEKEMQNIPHHLIDFLEPGESFSVAKYKEEALRAIEDIISRNKLPIVAGGTGLYVDTLINNTEFLDYEKTAVRDWLQKRADEEGIEELYRELISIDPHTAEKLHLNDTKRIIRALEVYYSTGKTISEQCELSHLNESPYSWCVVGINAKDRQYLYDRINLRVDLMLEAGLVDEAKEFYSCDISSTAKQAIGYKELKPYLDGLVSLEQAVEKLKMETRRYAKRQLTWFRKNENINWLYADELTNEQMVTSAVEIIKYNRR